MLQFFRKYQRFFFIVIAVVVIASFCFFGTGGVSTLSRQEDRTVIGKMLDGTRLTQEKVGRMTQFLSRSHFDFLDDRVPAPNWLNDGVIEKDFLQTSLGTMVAECVFDKVQEDLASAVRAITAFSPYRHPRAPLLTAEAIWSEFVPESNVLMTSVRSLPGEATAQTFSILTKLYLQQKAFPSLFCKRMLMMQEKQEKSLVPDEGIPYADVSLSGLHTMEEFFGTPYVQAVSQAILQGAAYARKIGLTVTTQEVRDQLLGNLQAAATRTGKEFPQDQLYAIFVQLIHGMGMEESECLALWKDVVLFRKYISSGSSLTQIDPSLVQEFYDFAKERANIECFTLPEALQLQDFSSLLQLQAYIEAVSSPRERATQISLPRKFLSLAEIEKKMPGLVQRDCVLEYACIDLKKEAASIGSKDVWAWEIEDAGWSLLTEKFAFIKNQGSVPLQDRFDELERLKEEERTLVDNFAREKILTSCEGKIKELLLTKEKTISRCSLGPKGEGLPLKEIRNKAALYAMIQALDERL
ncbi:MAG: hypothetical protein FJZ58_08255, partial [Chlamydiae bacterium]|nr:hypothetical protein [Chlamydiota bacterium]